MSTYWQTENNGWYAVSVLLAVALAWCYMDMKKWREEAKERRRIMLANISKPAQ